MSLRSVLCASVAGGSVLLAGAPVLAQAAAGAPDLEEVVVTGSRVARQGFDAPTPTTIVNSQALAERGSTNIGDFLNELPAFRVSQNRQTATQSSALAGQVYADLRGLGSIRTLTLVDGKRFVPSAATGQVDLNLVPTALVDRVEVVTGGASAIYGSDAVSGVVNVILNKRLQGIKGEVSAGISDYNDDFERRVSLAAGTSFAGGRGHFVIGGDYVKSDGVEDFAARPWSNPAPELVTFPATRPAGTPSRLYAGGVSYTGSPIGGIIIGPNADTTASNGADVLRGIGFGPGGATYAFDYGNDPGSGSAYNNTAPQGAYTRLGLALILPEDRKVAMAHVGFDFTDSLSGYLEGSYAKSGATFFGPSPRDVNTTSIVIRRDNPYLPENVRAIMTANNIASFPLARPNIDWAHSRVKNYNNTQRFVGGLDGKLPAGWAWDAYYEYGQNVYDTEIDNIRIEQNYRFAQDAVVNPANGQIVCRATLPGAGFSAAAAGCVPINLFGVNSPSAAAAAYINGTQTYKVTNKQQVVEANLRGNLFSTWAGPVAVATGASYRKDTSVGVSDPLAQANAYNFSNPKAFSGSFETKEAYAEALVPLAKDMTLARSLDVNGAVRYTDYSSSGAVTTWKLGATWEPVTGLKFRATRSRDIRAPNASELFSFTSTNTGLRNAFNGQSSALPQINEPSTSLEPEKADTKTFGVVFSPSFVPGLQASVDYFDITIDGAISSYAPQFLIDSCFAEVQRGAPGLFCSFVNRTGTGTATVINSVSVQLLNISSLKASGVDFEVSYRKRLGPGDLSARFFGTYTDHLISDDGLGTPRTYDAAGILISKGSIYERAGQVGGFGNTSGATSIPHWQLNGSVTYTTARYASTLQGRWVQGGKVDKTLVDPSEADYSALSPISVTGNDVKGRFYLTWSGSVNLVSRETRKVQLYAVVENLMNVEPPFPGTALTGLYDKMGRYYRAGVRFNY